MKSILLALLLALVAAPAAKAFDNPIPRPNQLVEQQLLPRFVSQLKLKSKTWHKGFQDISACSTPTTTPNKQKNKQSQEIKYSDKVARQSNPEA